MAVLMIGEVPGMTPEMYDGMAVNLMPRLREAKGFISHAAGMLGGEWRVTELWESEEDSARWFEANVKPSLPAGVVPNRTFHELHNLVRA
ncbi:MAG: hypothetical protein WEC75_10540 [Dehalococcoidia bacterium]